MPDEVRSRIWAWFGNPLVGVVGTIASVLGFMAGFWFYYAAHEEPELSFWVNPDRGVIVNSQQANVVRVMYGTRELHSDVTLVQVKLWNAGKRPIRPDDVLAPLVIRLNPPQEILSAEIRRASRGVVAPKLDLARFPEGVVPLSWKILEQDDGAVVQIVYAGQPSVRVDVDGVVVGQHVLKRATDEGGFGAPATRRRPLWLTLLMTLAFGIASMALGIFAGRRAARSSNRRILTWAAEVALAIALSITVALVASR